MLCVVSQKMLHWSRGLEGISQAIFFCIFADSCRFFCIAHFEMPCCFLHFLLPSHNGRSTTQPKSTQNVHQYPPCTHMSLFSEPCQGQSTCFFLNIGTLSNKLDGWATPWLIPPLGRGGDLLQGTLRLGPPPNNSLNICTNLLFSPSCPPPSD